MLIDVRVKSDENQWYFKKKIILILILKVYIFHKIEKLFEITIVYVYNNLHV